MSIALNSQGQIDYAQFICNRVLRIFPLFVFIFFVSLSLNRDTFKPEQLLYFFVTNIGLNAPTSAYFITGAAWTISFEFSFYLIFPFLARFALANGLSYLVKLILILMIFKVAGYSINEKSNLMYYSTLLGRLDQFLIGMLAAQVYALKKSSPKFTTLRLLIALLFLMLLIELQGFWASFLSPNPKNLIWIVWPTIEAFAWVNVLLSYIN